MKIKIIFILAALVTVATSCLKEPAAPTGGNKIMIGATTTDTTSYLFAKVSTQVSSTGGNQIWQHGHCWGINANPDTNNSHTTLGTMASPGKFTSELWGLTDNVKYFIRPYCTFQGNTVYGAQNEIMTLKRGKPVVVTDSAFEITISSAKISGTATFDSGFAITQKGICWDTAANPTLLKSIGHSEEGAGTGSFVSSITQLVNNRQYYFCAYSSNERGTSYGEIKQFVSGSIVLPAVLTSPVTDITNNFAACSGNVTNAGNGTVNLRGVCWSTDPNPTTGNTYTTSGTGTGVFLSYLPNLTSNTFYYVRAFATNEAGTAYGNEMSFTTLPNPNLPTVTTTIISNITSTSATSGGNVISDGGIEVTSRGVCWGKSPDLTIYSSHTIDGNGNGIFISNLTMLEPGTKYYVRAYAVNSVGIAYGNILTFESLFSVGQMYGGGIIFYVDITGSHGLICATTDQSSGVQWGCFGTLISGTSIVIGSGQSNTTNIVNGCGTAGFAALICSALELNGYSDWFLPSKDELNQMYIQKNNLGGFTNYSYWSSSEFSSNSAWYQNFSNGVQFDDYKSYSFYVRAIRAF